jgi:protein-S-isoprenylcysteine O-methyltransferase Ste14
MQMSTKKKLTVGQIIFTIFYLLLWPALFLFLSGDWLWPEGWIFSAWFLATTIAATIYLYLKDPALLAERYRKPGTGNQKPWDKMFVAVIMFVFLTWLVIMPLDSKRFRWTTQYPTGLKYVGAIMLLLSSFFLFRAFTDNTFLSPLVRVQRERKQQLVTTGVYGFVRHPMYLGALLMFLGVPLLAGSYVGIGVGLVMTLLMGVRALGEEKMLMEEFQDYADYKQKVRYRFIPFLW